MPKYQENKILSIDDLKKQALGDIVYLPGWNDESFIAKLRRPSILSLASKGKIPNDLLGSATKLFHEGSTGTLPLKDMEQILSLFAEAALVEPSMKSLSDAGIELTDQQKMAIYNYTQIGAKALIPFSPIQ